MRSDPIESRHRRFQRRDPGRGQWRRGNWAQAVSSTHIKPLISTHSPNARLGEDDWFKVMASITVHHLMYSFDTYIRVHFLLHRDRDIQKTERQRRYKS